MTIGADDSGHSADHAALYRLMTWLSPSFPIGAFSYSSGLEWSVEAGELPNRERLIDWLSAMLTQGQGLCDAIFLAHTHRATDRRDLAALAGIAELAAAFAPSRERQMETLNQGRAFVDAIRTAWGHDDLEVLVAACGDEIAYPVAVGVASALHGVAIDAALSAFLHGVVSNWVSAAVRLIPLGQSDGQRVLAALEPAVAGVAERAATASLDDLGSATFRADLASMRHEAQYTRLFRS
jgi:urease accessory protein